MEMQQVKFIAVDMDGTLLNSKKELPPDFYPTFHALTKKNIIFAIASGRQYYNIRNQFSSVSDDMVFIAENGSYVVHKDKEILVQPLQKERVHTLVDIARNIRDTEIILCGKKQAYIESNSPEFLHHVNMYYDKKLVVKDLQQVEGDEILKIALCDFGGSEKNSYPYFRHLENDIQVKVSGALWLDLSDKLANKGRAVRAVQQLYNVRYDETMVFGDYMNDLEMMQEGYFSYAMANAHPEVKAAARFIADSNDDNGVMKVLGSI
ncbi:MAG: HAD family hydrolase [Chitinophagaceae bacterium]|nr:HAD family hydrolase [Chitinophagaceae bacterium]MCW5929370.1 HAD family hydrolase [Chitinophagaceae bacterium]